MIPGFPFLECWVRSLLLLPVDCDDQILCWRLAITVDVAMESSTAYSGSDLGFPQRVVPLSKLLRDGMAVEGIGVVVVGAGRGHGAGV